MLKYMPFYLTILIWALSEFFLRYMNEKHAKSKQTGRPDTGRPVDITAKPACMVFQYFEVC